MASSWTGYSYWVSSFMRCRCSSNPSPVVPVNAPHPDIGRLLVTYCISAADQVDYNHFSVRASTPRTLVVPKDAVVYDEIAAEAQLPEIPNLRGIQ